MNSKTEFTLLGTGSSGGVPRIGNHWGACDPNNIKNRRRRCSMLVELSGEQGKTTVLIDTGPDMREQLLSAQVSYLDAVLLTHSHADHIFGFDDLRQLSITHRELVNVYMDDSTATQVMRAFDYCFEQPVESKYQSFCQRHRITAAKQLSINGKGGTITAIPFEVDHGGTSALGFRIGDLVYVPDIKSVTDPASLAILENTDTLITDAVRYIAHPTHMNVEEALVFIDKIKPRRAILTNMNVDLDYTELSNKLPDNVEVAYDGLTVQFSS